MISRRPAAGDNRQAYAIQSCLRRPQRRRASLAYAGEGSVAPPAGDTIRRSWQRTGSARSGCGSRRTRTAGLLARALWWGRPDDTQPIALDDLDVDQRWATPPGSGPALKLVVGHTACWPPAPVQHVRCRATGAPVRRSPRRSVTASRPETERVSPGRSADALQVYPRPAPPSASGRLIFTEGTDEDFLDAFQRTYAGARTCTPSWSSRPLTRPAGSR